MIKEGNVVLMKSTGEPVFVLGLEQAEDHSNWPALSGMMVKVRRGNISQNGTSYHSELYAIEELESIDDARNRQIAEREEEVARIVAAKQRATPTSNLAPSN